MTTHATADLYRVYAESLDGKRRDLGKAWADNGGRGLFDLYANECNDEECIVIEREEATK
jgi:hypothetical protein